MAVETTALGFKKPDGNELVRGGDNVIADNAQKAQDYVAELLTTTTDQETRLDVVEMAAFTAGALTLIEDPADPGFYIIGV